MTEPQIAPYGFWKSPIAAGLIMAGTIGLCSIALVGLLPVITQKQRFKPGLLNGVGSPVAERQLPSEADDEFARYVLRSLEVIDRKAKGNSRLPTRVTNRPTGANLSGAIVEKVYYPVHPSQNSSIPPLPQTNSSNHTLVGVMELGERSAALFEIDGINHRINMGESIGTSGWMLVDVKKGEATIRHNGEVRSVYTGQTF